MSKHKQPAKPAVAVPPLKIAHVPARHDIHGVHAPGALVPVALGGAKGTGLEAKIKLTKVINLSALPTPPPSFSWLRGSLDLNAEGALNIEGNDSFGDCVEAAAAHIIMQTLAASGNPYAPITPDQVLWAYSQCTDPPFDPATGANDNGTDLGTMLDWWQSHGFLEDGSHKILGYASIDATKPDEVAAALWLFENGISGQFLLQAWVDGMETMTPGFVWDAGSPPDPDAGHSTDLYGFNDNGTFENTWGFPGTMTWAANAAVRTPAANGSLQVVLTEDAINRASGKAPTGFDRDQLLKLLKRA